MVKLANWQNEQNENVFVDFLILPILLAEWNGKVSKLQNEQNENVFVDFLILLAEWNGKVSKLAEWAEWKCLCRFSHSAHSAGRMKW